MNLKCPSSKSLVSPNLSRRRFTAGAAALPLLLALPGRAASNSTIHKLEGQVYVNNQLANMDTRLRAGDQIVVAYGGVLAMSIGGDAFLLREGSVLEIARGNNLLVSGLRLLTGAMLAVFDKRSAPVHIATSTAVIGIRGTGVYVSAEPHKLYTCTCYGKTDLRIGGHVEEISATHHNAHEVSDNGKGAMTMQSMEVLGHTDDELRMLEGYVGRKPLFDM